MGRYVSYLSPLFAAADARYRRDVETLSRLVAEGWFARAMPTDDRAAVEPTKETR